jgi:hypothetical protein
VLVADKELTRAYIVIGNGKQALKRGVGAHYSDVVSMQRHPFASTAEILGYLGLYSMSACVFTATPAPTDINWEDFAQRKRAVI